MADAAAVVPDAFELMEPELDNDPSQKDGFRTVYDKECPFEMRLQETDEAPQEVGTLEAVRCKVCVQGDASAPTTVRLELSSEQDLFFHYTHVIDERGFRAVREEQRLMIEFQDYPNVLARSLNQAIKEPHAHLAVFIMNRDGNARLDFIQNLEYKFVELLSVSFLRSPDAVVREQLSFRYAALRAKLAMCQSKLGEVISVVKIKNPSLLLTLSQKPVSAASASAGSGAGSFLGGTAAFGAPSRTAQPLNSR